MLYFRSNRLSCVWVVKTFEVLIKIFSLFLRMHRKDCIAAFFFFAGLQAFVIWKKKHIHGRKRQFSLNKRSCMKRAYKRYLKEYLAQDIFSEGTVQVICRNGTWFIDKEQKVNWHNVLICNIQYVNYSFFEKNALQRLRTIFFIFTVKIRVLSPKKRTVNAVHKFCSTIDFKVINSRTEVSMLKNAKVCRTGG